MADATLNMVEVARSKRHLALLTKLNSSKPLTLREIEELGEYEQKAQKRAKAKAPKDRPPRRRHLSSKYADIVETLAGIFVGCGENCSRATTRVRELVPGLEKFQANQFGRWKDNAEWIAALAEAREDAKFERELKAARRGRQFLKWAVERMEKLIGELKQAIADGDEKATAAFEGRVLKLNESMRSEEKYQLENERLATGKATAQMQFTITFGGREDGTTDA